IFLLSLISKPAKTPYQSTAVSLIRNTVRRLSGQCDSSSSGSTDLPQRERWPSKTLHMEFTFFLAKIAIWVWDLSRSLEFDVPCSKSHRGQLDLPLNSSKEKPKGHTRINVRKFEVNGLLKFKECVHMGTCDLVILIVLYFGKIKSCYLGSDTALLFCEYLHVLVSHLESYLFQTLILRSSYFQRRRQKHVHSFPDAQHLLWKGSTGIDPHYCGRLPVVLPPRRLLYQLFRHSPTGILMQREDIILEWIFLPNKQSKKLKTYVEKISDLILKGKLRVGQLAGIDPAEIVIPLTKEDIEKLWAESEPWQRACSNFLGEINSKYPKSDRIELIKRADWILPRIVWETPISGVRTFYTDANKQGKAGYKSEDLSKVVQSPYNSVQKSELYAILLVLMDFSEPLNIVTDSQYAERVVLHIETAEFIPDESELTSLFIQLRDIIRNRKHPLYITHIRSYMGLPGPLAQGNDEIDKLLIGNVLEASEFHKKHHVNSKGLKRDFSITWQQAKEIVRKCPTCSFYNQTLLPAGCNPKGTQRNEIWQMDVFHFAEFGKLKYVHHTIDTYSGFHWVTALSSEKADSVLMHLLEVMAIMGIPAQIKTDNAPAYVS
ncbi:hypothetical protein STEG23_019310, partial [Scotinomys teguina]